MGNGQWALGIGHWAMGNGQWAMGNGQWAFIKLSTHWAGLFIDQQFLPRSAHQMALPHPKFWVLMTDKSAPFGEACPMRGQVFPKGIGNKKSGCK